jgi:phosphocarrier protein NPr/phosphocarrier protein
MSSDIRTKSVTILNEEGLHARPASLFAQIANQFNSQISVARGEESVDGKSILSILTLGATQGVRLIIRAEGTDAYLAVKQLSQLVESGFGE